MNIITKKTDIQYIEGAGYEAPEVSVMELESEGVLCASGQFDPYEEDTLDW